MAQNEDTKADCSKTQNNSSIQHISRNPLSLTHEAQAHSSTTPAVFSIATPAVTILPMTEDLNDTSFMMPTTSYQNQDGSIANSPFCMQDKEKHGLGINQSGGIDIIQEQEVSKQINHRNDQAAHKHPDTITKTDETNQTSKNYIPNTSTETQTGISLHNSLEKQNLSSSCSEESRKNQSDDSEKRQLSSGGPGSVTSKRRNKTNKKNTKLDAKSKLEKSRQSARECRARKKLRYQYLEDLVCNREKAVVKLREELSMFCEMSKQMDGGTISDKDRNLIVNQSKENNRDDETTHVMD